jgi:predicted anti-sigma-YlaC factor YlaD
MSALEESYVEEFYHEAAPRLRALESAAGPTWMTGPSLALRREARARRLARRRRSLAGLALVLATIVLAWPGHAFGGTTASGLSTDLATSAVLAPGMDYVVQPGDSVNSIAALVNPSDPAAARVLVIRELRSDVVVAGEHVLIP